MGGAAWERAKSDSLGKGKKLNGGQQGGGERYRKKKNQPLINPIHTPERSPPAR